MNNNSKAITSSLILIAIIASAMALIYTKSIMIPFVLSLFIAFIIAPLINYLQVKWKFPRFISITFTILVIFLGLFVLSLLITSSIKASLNNIDEYKQRLLLIVNSSLNLLNSLGIDTDQFDKQKLLAAISNLPVFSYLKFATGHILTFIMDTFLVMIFVIFLVSENFKSPSKSTVMQKSETQIRTYLITKVITSSATGLLTALILFAFGVDMAIMFGVFAFILNFIPTLGSIIAVLLPIPIAVFQLNSYIAIIFVIILPGVVQFIIGNILEPKFMGDSLDLHPVTILLFLMFWGLIWGAPGMILATPIAVITKQILKKSESTNIFSELMAGRLP